VTNNSGDCISLLFEPALVFLFQIPLHFWSKRMLRNESLDCRVQFLLMFVDIEVSLNVLGTVKIRNLE
jgi:hypothetical protein